MEDMCSVLKAVSEPTRIRILRVLIAARVPLCGGEFVEALDERHYNLSRHLKILKNVGLLVEKKEGRWVYHSLQKGTSTFTTRLISAISSMQDISGVLGEDLRRLKVVLKKKKKKLSQ